MSSQWSLFLADKGARIENGIAADFGDPAGELLATVAVPVMADGSWQGVLFFAGDDAAAFLQGQLSCDVSALAAGSGTYGSYCTPKGRVIANFFIWRADNGFYMAMPQELLPALEKRLRMFVMRSKVRVDDASARMVLLGLAAPTGEAGLSQLAVSVPDTNYCGARVEDGWLVRLSPTRWLWAGEAETATKAWSLFSGAFKPVGATAWPSVDIRAGIPWITAPTQEQFVPQMINLELIGGVSFQKGCYTGQEIVARSQYLGKLKRRMYLANISSNEVPSPGTALYSDDLGDQASGMVVNAHASPNGGVDMLAVAQVASVDASVVHLGSLGGPALRFHALPYALP